MRKILSILAVVFTTTSLFSQGNALSLKGIIDFDLVSAGYTGKAIHLVANSNIPDLSIYGIGVANNASGGDGQEYSFPQIAIQSGEHLLLARDSTALSIYFDICFSDFDYILQASNAISQNGNDAVELFENSVIIETFGDVNVNGTGTAWEYLDSWAYKDQSGSVSFSGGNWIFGGVSCTSGSVTTQTSSCPYPMCSSSVYVHNNDRILFSIYPNPSSDYITLDTEIENITIHDALGNQIKDFNFYKKTLNIKEFPNGIYIISSNNGKNQQKFIKY